MQKSFSTIFNAPTQQGQRVLVDVPFNVWDEYNIRGPVPVCVEVNGVSFECKLVPKGKGFYTLCLTEEIQKSIKASDGDALLIQMEPREKQTPAAREPIDPKDARKIDSIKLVREPVNTACGQACIAMLAGVPIEDVFETMGTKGPTSTAMLLDAMYHYKIRHAEHAFRLSKKHPILPETCLVSVRMPGYGHWVIYHNNIFYDPEFGELSVCHDNGKISFFIEIYT